MFWSVTIVYIISLVGLYTDILTTFPGYTSSLWSDWFHNTFTPRSNMVGYIWSSLIYLSTMISIYSIIKITHLSNKLANSG